MYPRENTAQVLLNNASSDVDRLEVRRDWDANIYGLLVYDRLDDSLVGGVTAKTVIEEYRTILGPIKKERTEYAAWCAVAQEDGSYEYEEIGSFRSPNLALAGIVGWVVRRAINGPYTPRIF